MGTSMRWTCMLFGTILLFGGCQAKEQDNHPMAPLNRDLLIGKWEADDENQFVQGCEFAADNSFHMTIWHSKAPVNGKFAWSGPTTLTVEYHPSEEAKNAYKSSSAAYRENIQEIGKKSPQYGPQILGSANNYPDEVPDMEELTVGLSERNKPTLAVATKKGLTFRFRKPE